MSVAQMTQTFSGTGTGTFAPVGSTGVSVMGWANLSLGGTSPVGTVKLEKSYDNGSSWFDVSQDAAGTLAAWALNSTEISVQFYEPEIGVIYRCNCTAYTSGTLTSRISQ